MYNSIYPAYQRNYQGINYRQINRKKDEEKNSQSSQNAENNLQEQKKQPQNINLQNQFQTQIQTQINPQMQQSFPNGEKVAIDYTKRQINIEQVLSDFRSTTNAIGAPDDIKLEVSSYLSLIESQAQKDNPNPQIIRANLKSASQILDDYITKALNKPSKVVESWVDALFLQQIDYKAPVKEESTEAVEEVQEEVIEEVVQPSEVIVEIQEETPVKTVRDGIFIPEDPQLKRMFIQAKKYAAIDENEKALYAFQNAMFYSDEIGDTQTSAMIHYEEGKLYDSFNNVEDALYNYNRAAKQSTDKNIKAQAHLSMGKIYDDYVKFEPAVDHLCAAVSFAGDTDNLKLQTQALSTLAKVHTDRYDKKNAFMFMDMSDVIATETKDSRTVGIISSRNAKYCEKLDEKVKALNYYQRSSKSYNDVNEKEGLAKNYRDAAQIMLGYGNKAKAKTLLSKAYVAAQKTDNNELKREITLKLSTM